MVADERVMSSRAKYLEYTSITDRAMSEAGEFLSWPLQFVRELYGY